MPDFSVENLEVSFAEADVLKGVSFCVKAGRTLALVGPSGCGKSTLLKCLLGLVEPSAGRVLYGGQKMSGEHARHQRKKFGYLVQSGGLFPHLKVRDNVSIMANKLGWAKEDIQQHLEALCDLVHLPYPLLERYPNALSGGQRQRAALMRALMLDPEVLLLDEPFGALDTLVRHDLQQELKDIFERLRKTVVLVTHDMAEAVFFADQILVLNAGHIEQIGGAEDLLLRPVSPFVSRFLSARRELPEMRGDLANREEGGGDRQASGKAGL